VRRTARLLAACCLLTSLGCSGDEGGGDSERVALRLLAFRDAALTVRAGTTVSWVNEEDLAHTVTTGSYSVDPATDLRCQDCARKDGLLDEQLPTRGARAGYTFRTPGTFTYFCDFHRGMNGTVTVTP